MTGSTGASMVLWAVAAAGAAAAGAGRVSSSSPSSSSFFWVERAGDGDRACVGDGDRFGDDALDAIFFFSTLL